MYTSQRIWFTAPEKKGWTFFILIISRLPEGHPFVSMKDNNISAVPQSAGGNATQEGSTRKTLPAKTKDTLNWSLTNNFNCSELSERKATCRLFSQHVREVHKVHHWDFTSQSLSSKKDKATWTSCRTPQSFKVSMHKGGVSCGQAVPPISHPRMRRLLV